MHDPAVSLSRLVTAVAWSAVLALIGAAWLAFLNGDRSLAELLGLTGCATSAVAATLNVRCYSFRLARLVRAVADLPASAPARSLHSLSER